MPNEAKLVVGRLAPSPTGLLHLGNAWAFLLAWLACRKKNGCLILRFEDIDQVRSRQTNIEAIKEDLLWLGLSWDEGEGCEGAHAPYRQSLRQSTYESALDALKPYLYPCFCSRKELKLLAEAPNSCDAPPLYPGTCKKLSLEERKRRIEAGVPFALRFSCKDAPISFFDAIYGRQIIYPKDFGGDFALRRSDGVISYQLAVAVDDACMGVTQVVRGRDILLSTGRQIQILTRLGMPTPEEYVHVPLLLDHVGERFAKRHKSLAIRTLRDHGVTAPQIIGFLAHLAGINPSTAPLEPQEIVSAFSYDVLPKEDICLDERGLF